MDNNEIKYTNAPIFDLTDYAISKEIVKDFPKILELYFKVLELLLPYRHYAGVSLVTSTIEDSSVLMTRQLKQYKKIKETKAKK